MSHQVLFSIILPTYNSEETLGGTLNSIFRQKFIDFEIIIIDGNSNDRTLSIVAEFTDKRLIVKSEKDSGVYDAMNKGINLSSGKWVYFLGSDDTLYDDEVLEFIANQINEKDDIIYGNVMSEPLNGLYDGVFTMDKLFNRNICHQAIFIRKTVFEKTGLFDLKYLLQSDWDHNIKWFMDKTICKRFVDRIIAYYSGTGLSTKKRDLEFEKDKTSKFLRFSAKDFNKSLKKYLNLSLAIQKKENRNYPEFLYYKFKFWLNRIFERYYF